MSASESESAEKPSSESAGGFSNLGSSILIDEAGRGTSETRNDVDDEVPRLVWRILARFIGVISFVKACEDVSSSPVCSSANGGERWYENADITFRTGVARVRGIGGLVLRASLGPIFSDETTSRRNG